MSARAAWRLEQLGFDDVYDYEGGRKDWQEAGLPTEGTDPRGPIVADAITVDPPSCEPGSTVGSARTLLGDQRTQVVVVNALGVILGVMRKESWAAPDESLVENAMRLGPSTVRPGSLLAPLVERMREKDTESVLVSDPEGRLVGVLDREDGESFLSGDLVESSFEVCECCPGWWRYRMAAG
jgi:CBS domain-containing protein